MMFKFIRIGNAFWFGLALLLATMMFSYYGTKLWATSEYKLFDWYQPPQYENIQGEKITTAHAGGPLVVRYFVIRYPMKCWAQSTIVVSGKITSQLPIQYSQILADHTVKMEVPNLYHMPSDLPAGLYHAKLNVFPECEGFDAKPFSLAMPDIIVD
jgi:hypothetical protein